MPQKKSNGFMMFTMEWKKKYGQHMSMDETINATGAIWKNMSAEEREPHNKAAKSAPPFQGKAKEKLTCYGKPISHVERERQEEEKRAKHVKTTIETTVTRALESGMLKDEKFHFIALNYFACIFNTKVYVPAEIALIEFSLNKGVIRKYHTYVNPQVNFYGNAYAAKDHSDTTHKLPVPPESFGDKGLGQIYTEILSFLYNEETESYYNVYTLEISMEIVQSALKYLLSDEAANHIELDMDIFPLQSLLFNLKCATAKHEKPKNRFITDAMIERDAFEYAAGIACDYHEDIDRCNYCSLSQAIRWGYTFADCICKDLSITFVPGQHMPAGLPSVTHRGLPKELEDNVCNSMGAVSLQNSNARQDDQSDNISVATSFKSCISNKSSTKKSGGFGNIDYEEPLSPNANPWQVVGKSKPLRQQNFIHENLKADEFPPSRGRGRGMHMFQIDERPAGRRGRGNTFLQE